MKVAHNAVISITPGHMRHFVLFGGKPLKKLCPDQRPEEIAATQQANDSEPLFIRLLEFAVRGCNTPESLTPYEIKQISFALLSRLSLDESVFQPSHE